ncbi:MAG: PAS domain S-box protein [Candidatus Marinimicrobia bacterium]|nr:PAS domain S-box protein [Candidatus Neomarinimicrobiota bacterium]
MNVDIYKKIIFHSSFGYSYNRIILDEQGVPVDFEFLEVNRQFQVLTHTSGKNLAGKTYFQVFPTLKQAGEDWLKIYADVALKGGAKEFQQYSRTLDKWYKVKAFHIKKYYFVAILFDMTDEFRIAGYAKDFLKLDGEKINYQKFTDDLYKITNAAVVIYNEVDEKSRTTQTRAITGLRKFLEKGSKILGMDFIDRQWELPRERFHLVRKNTKLYFPGFADILEGSVSRNLLAVIRQTRFNNPAYLFSISVKNRLIGDFILVTRKNGLLKNESLVELYAQMAGLQIYRHEVEHRYQTTNENLNLVLEATENGYWDRNFQEDKIFYNDQYFTMLGYAPDELPHTPDIWRELMHPEDRKGALPRIRTALSLGIPYEINFRLRCKDGSWKWIMGKGKSFQFDEKGEPGRAVGIHMDIDEMKKAESRLQESELHFRALFEYSPTPFWEMDFSCVKDNIEEIKKSGVEDFQQYFSENPAAVRKCIEGIQVLNTNNSAMKFYEAVTKEELAAGLTKIIPGETYSQFLKILVAIANHETYSDFDIEFQTLSGNKIYAHLFWKVLPGFEPNFRKVFISTVNITDRVIDNLRIKENEERLQSINSALPDLIFEFDRSGNFIYTNTENSPKLYYKDNFIGRNVREILPPEIAEMTLEKIWLTLAEKKTQHYEYCLEIEEGKPEYFESRMAPKGADHVLAIVTDTTERNKLEEERRQFEIQRSRSQKLETIGTLAGGIAHDFNNLLTPIMGYSDIIKSQLKENDPIYDSIDEIYQASQRAKELVLQMLSFSREADRDLRPVLVNSILKETVKLLRSSIPESIEIKLDMRKENCKILGDPVKLHQVIMNLGTNAYHAMEDTRGTLTVILDKVALDKEAARLNPGLHEGDYVKLTVSDTGTGMDRETMERIFEPFFTTKKQGKGTGMGLSVVHGIVKSHQGGIKVASTPGQGTTFILHFPWIDSVDTVSPDKSVSLPKGRGNIMVVDDRDYIGKMLKNMLTDYGYQVFEFRDSREAWRNYETNAENFDLIITDRNMPGLTGIELAGKINNHSRTVPVVMLTGQGHNLDDQRMKEAGIAKLIHKPVQLQEMLLALNTLLAEKPKK